MLELFFVVVDVRAKLSRLFLRNERLDAAVIDENADDAENSYDCDADEACDC